MADPIKIHPYDLYIVIRDNPSAKVIERGREIEIDGKLYHQTTSVQAVTTEFSDSYQYTNGSPIKRHFSL